MFNSMIRLICNSKYLARRKNTQPAFGFAQPLCNAPQVICSFARRKRSVRLPVKAVAYSEEALSADRLDIGE
jgi:hypothetical protein